MSPGTNVPGLGYLCILDSRPKKILLAASHFLKGLTLHLLNTIISACPMGLPLAFIF